MKNEQSKRLQSLLIKMYMEARIDTLMQIHEGAMRLMADQGMSYQSAVEYSTKSMLDILEGYYGTPEEPKTHAGIPERQ